jgi:hypothetical protein
MSSHVRTSVTHGRWNAVFVSFESLSMNSTHPSSASSCTLSCAASRCINICTITMGSERKGSLPARARKTSGSVMLGRAHGRPGEMKSEVALFVGHEPKVLFILFVGRFFAQRQASGQQAQEMSGYGAIEECPPSESPGRSRGSRLQSVCAGLAVVSVVASVAVILVCSALAVAQTRTAKGSPTLCGGRAPNARHRTYLFSTSHMRALCVAQHFGGTASARRRSTFEQLDKVGACAAAQACAFHVHIAWAEELTPRAGALACLAAFFCRTDSSVPRKRMLLGATVRPRESGGEVDGFREKACSKVQHSP